ncbi:MAG: LysM peptidoglycan-binding domain-containing protein [Bdellovibrionaceae bacterium]|nr:LysM peptidoglycan-binding domain-containing protein [Pseudobdellovibrionaceae bacterium]
MNPEPGFKQKMAPAEKALPLPVEIAQDIAQISENGILYLSKESDREISSDKNTTNIFKEQPIVSKVNVAKEQNLTEIIGSNGPLAKKIVKKQEGPLAIGKILKRLPQSTGGKTVNYLVKLGDTLMKIAFEKYGNYLRWREIYKSNKNKMSHWTKMAVGTELVIHNVKYVYIKKEGTPYLIRKGDTLKSISKQIYGTSSKWQEIWRNNPQLVLNPKKIYAGFKIYYKELEQRQPTQTK